jgi:hypothetical protein
MRKLMVVVSLMPIWGVAYGASPTQNLVKSCLLAQSSAPSVTIQDLNAHEVSQEDNYAAGFNATYLFRYRGSNIGYAENKTGDALIFLNKIHTLSSSSILGDNRGVRPDSFDPTLAQWSVVKEMGREFFCVSFNFDGLGQSGGFQNIRGGYFINTKSELMYFVVRNVRK